MLSGDIVGKRESTRDCLDRCDAGPLCLFFTWLRFSLSTLKLPYGIN